MQQLLTDKIVLVAGGTSGVGAGIARAAVREGATVVVSGRRPEPGDALAAELGERASAVTGDVSDPEQAKGVVAATIERHGRIDCLVNCAGLTDRGSVLDTTPELFDAHIATNLRGPFFTMQAAIADMTARSAPGTIVNIASISAQGGQPYLAPYVAAKAGLIGLAESLHYQLSNTGVQVTALCPGFVRTNIYRAAGDHDPDLPASMWSTPERTVTHGMRRLIRTRKAIVVPERHDRLLLAGWRLLPKALRTRTAQAMYEPTRIPVATETPPS